MSILGFDTSTGATTVALLRPSGEALEGRDDPEPGERPGHATRLLGLVREVLDAAPTGWDEVERIAVGVGPGSFTGLRIGVATARALSQARSLPLAGVSSLHALAAGAAGAGPVAAVLDARRGECFAAAYEAERVLLEPAALDPAELARRLAGVSGRGSEPLLAVGEGALRFRGDLEPAGIAIPPDGDPRHRLSARHVCALAAGGETEAADAVLPHYIRLPDAERSRRQRSAT